MKNNFWIITMHNSNRQLRQVTLSGEVLLEYRYCVIAFVPTDVVKLKKRCMVQKAQFRANIFG
jgi:hypothetical protein